MIMDHSNLAAISTSHLFKSLDSEGRAMLLENATITSFSAGKVIVREGDPGQTLYIIKDGEVQINTTRAGEQLPLATLSIGACFGEVSVISGNPRTATVVAVTDCTLLSFTRRHIEEVLDAYPKVRKLLESVIVGRARDTIEKITRPMIPEG